MAWLKMFKARKEYKCDICGKIIKKGEEYYRFKLTRFSPVQIRCANCKPKPSEMTTSDFLAQVYEIEERIGELSEYTIEEIDEMLGEIEDIINELEELRDETEEKLYNLPEQFQDTDVGMLLQERIDALDEMIEDLEYYRDQLEELAEDIGDEIDEDTENEFQNIVDEVASISYGGP